MFYRITLRENPPKAESIKLLREATGRPISEIRDCLPGAGIHVVRNARDQAIEQSYREWANTVIELFSHLRDTFPDHEISYSARIEGDWETIGFDYFSNFLNSSVRDHYQTHD